MIIFSQKKHTTIISKAVNIKVNHNCNPKLTCPNGVERCSCKIPFIVKLLKFTLSLTALTKMITLFSHSQVFNSGSKFAFFFFGIMRGRVLVVGGRVRRGRGRRPGRSWRWRFRNRFRETKSFRNRLFFIFLNVFECFLKSFHSSLSEMI